MGTLRLPWPLLWTLLQLGWRPGWLLDAPSRSADQLSVTEGANVSFTCHFPTKSGFLQFNWYRLCPGNRTEKLAASPKESGQHGRRWHVTATNLSATHNFHMHLLSAQQNDSGLYLCAAIYLHPEIHILESHMQLNVTRRVLMPTEHPSPTPRSTSKSQGLVASITSGLVVVLLLLLAWLLATTFPQAVQGRCAGRSKDVPLKEDLQVAPVFTVDYGQLDFELREKTPEPPVPSTPEPTEYATIVFTQGMPGFPGRRASADGLQESRPLPPEDGHCSWPL